MSRDIVTVIKSVNYSEADKILTVFGKNSGKFTLFAKGIRKINSKNRGNMQTLSTSSISYYEGRGMPLLTESKLINCIDLEKLNVTNVRRTLFMLNKFLQDYDSYPNLFDSLQRALKRNLDTESTNKLRIIFLKEMGFLGDFNSCKECGSTEDLRYLCKDDFALFCKNCYSKRGGFPLGDSPYTSTHLVKSLDEYIKRIVEEI